MDMKTLMLFTCLACITYSAKGQNLKFKSDSLSVAYGYIQKIDKLSPGQLFNVPINRGPWKGSKIDSLEQFNVYQLPTDRMICLVPNQNNPSNVRITNPPNSPAQIPNPLYYKRPQPKR